MGLCERCRRQTYCKDAFCRSIESADILECDEFDEIVIPKKGWFS